MIKKAGTYGLFIFFGLTTVTAQQMYIHDPVVIRENGTYHLYCTHKGIAGFSSEDLSRWQYTGPVFREIPEWTFRMVPGFEGHIWAPDISYHEGLFYLYYSVSTYEKNTSCIGIATNTTLDTDSNRYQWMDRGIVVQSIQGRDLWNAIDPNLAFNTDGRAWLCFGSFWQGIKLVKLDSSLLRPEKPEEWYTIARRHRSDSIPDARPGDGAIEAPFIFRKNDYFYLLVSFDYCCRGVNSNYKIMVGRSKDIRGPYLDKDGTDMFRGGGSLVMAGDYRFPGLGHCAVETFDDIDYLIFHAYDAEDEGRPVLRILELSWDEQLWPVPVKGSELNCTRSK